MSRNFLGGFKGLPKNLEGGFKESSRGVQEISIQDCFIGFQENFKGFRGLKVVSLVVMWQ